MKQFFQQVIDEYLTFSDLFKGAVSKNLKLLGAQKLRYLKGALKKEAIKVALLHQIAGDDFQIA